MSWELLSASKKSKGVTLDPTHKVNCVDYYLLSGSRRRGRRSCVGYKANADRHPHSVAFLFWKKESGSRLRNYLCDLLFGGTVCCAH